MGIVTWIVLGLLAGIVAKFLMPGTGSRGWLLTTGLGMLGAAVGGLLGIVAGFGDVNDLKIGSLLLAVLGAMLVLSGYRMVAKRNNL